MKIEPFGEMNFAWGTRYGVRVRDDLGTWHNLLCWARLDALRDFECTSGGLTVAGIDEVMFSPEDGYTEIQGIVWG